VKTFRDSRGLRGVSAWPLQCGAQDRSRPFTPSPPKPSAFAFRAFLGSTTCIFGTISATF
jgi:hypothetical protein